VNIKINFVSPTCADAQVFFIWRLTRFSDKPPGDNHDLKHSFPVLTPAFFV